MAVITAIISAILVFITGLVGLQPPQYTNPTLGVTLTPPPQNTIEEIEDHTIAVWQPSTLHLHAIDFLFADSESITETTLVAKDLLCAADSPSGSIWCEQPQAVSFINKQGVKGYRVDRIKHHQGQVDYPGTFQDHVYIFSVTTPYRAVMLLVENPTPENLALLDQTADSLTP